jgi:tetraacyldisaccharide 4'-kinase
MVSATSREQRWLEIVSGCDRSARASLARGGLTLLSWLYGAGVRVYRGLYDLGLLRQVRLPCAVVSVGNITVGGTGKSTTVRWVVRTVRDAGARPVILSYGYRAGSEARVTVVSDGVAIRVPVAQSGDEPRMLAEALPGVPVVIGKQRRWSGALAVEQFGADVCVLDDAFQYWRLAKDLEIVLIDARCPFGYGHLLPRGLLREPLSQLRRADVLLVTNDHRVSPEARDRLYDALARRSPRALLAAGRHRPAGLRELATAATWPLDWLAGRRVRALSSLGNPEAFEETLREAGVSGVAPARYPDHHALTREQFEAEAARAAEEDALVTTEKDAVKLEARWRSPVPVLVLAVEMEITRGRQELEQRLRALGKSRVASACLAPERPTVAMHSGWLNEEQNRSSTG